MQLVWFRNDLRCYDNHALSRACEMSKGNGVMAVVVLSAKQWQLQDESKCRVQFWLANVASLKAQLAQLNIPLKILRAPTNAEIPACILGLAQTHNVTDIHFNREYALYESKRDNAVATLLSQHQIKPHAHESDLVIPAGQLLNKQGGAYKVFTPFSKAWRQAFSAYPSYPLPLPAVLPKQNADQIKSDDVPSSVNYGLNEGADWLPDLWPAGEFDAHQRLQDFIKLKFIDYKEARDFPSLPATSSLSPYLTVGVLSTRQCIAAAQAYADDEHWFENTWITELIWREFYRHLLVLFPEMNKLEPFKPDIEAKLTWHYDEDLFKAWCEGRTGVAIVDAGMQQLNKTGWMHNRVRMVVASYLTKILRQDWRLGAKYFMRHLIDGDFASNLGGWQWSASVGADAAPYFRIFNPMRQAERFDAKGHYISQWLPELTDLNAVQQHDLLFTQPAGRPLPVVDYAQERKRSIEQYNA